MASVDPHPSCRLQVCGYSASLAKDADLFAKQRLPYVVKAAILLIRWVAEPM